MLDQVLRRAGDVFDRHVRVNPVLIKRVDDIDLEPLKGALDSQLKALRSAVQARSTLHPTGIDTDQRRKSSRPQETTPSIDFPTDGI